MRDAAFSGFLVAVAGAVAVSFAVRVARGGAVRSERVGRAGGSVLLGRNLSEAAFWAIRPLCRACVALGISANAITWAALVLGLGAGVALAFGLLGFGTMLATASALFDALDGQIAREAGTSSDAGEVLDAAVDRYTELFFLGGIAIFYRASAIWLALTLAALCASYMVSYATAKAEALGVPPPQGLMRRHERAAYLLTGSGVSGLFASWLAVHLPVFPAAPLLFALAVVAAVGNVSAVRRLQLTARAVRARELASSRSVQRA